MEKQLDVPEALKTLDQISENLINNLKASDMAELKSLNNPPADLIVVTGALMTILGKPTDWASFKKEIKAPKVFVQDLQLFDKDNSAHLIPKLKKLVTLPQFDEKQMQKKSAAVSGIAIWVKFFYKYIILVEKVKKEGGQPKNFISSPAKRVSSQRKKTVKKDKSSPSPNVKSNNDLQITTAFTDWTELDQIQPSNANEWASAQNDEETSVQIQNKFDSAIRIEWMDFNSEAKEYNTIYAGEEFNQLTYVGHFWRIIDEKTEGVFCYFEALSGPCRLCFNGPVFSPKHEKCFDQLHDFKIDQALRIQEDPIETQPAFLIIKTATRSRKNSSVEDRNSPDAMQQETTDGMQQELNREREENEKLRELYDKVIEEKEQLMIDYRAKSSLCLQLQLELNSFKQVSAEPAVIDDLSDIPQDYRDNWNLMSIKASNDLFDNQKQAMQEHYVRKSTDDEYRQVCEQQRNEAFIAADVNVNGFLTLDQWKVFCQTQCQNIGRRIGVVLNTVDEEQMELTFKMNQFSGNPNGITLSDFLKKAELDIRLMKAYAATHCQ